MANDRTIKTFTAIDIEKYHKGLLSPAEMHEIEKAALDDPFLADALEGYATPGVDAVADITALKKKLSERTEENKVIPLAGFFRRWKVAALILLVAGAGFWIYRLSFTERDRSIATLNEAGKKEVSPPAATVQDSVSAAINPAGDFSDTTSYLRSNTHTGKDSFHFQLTERQLTTTLDSLKKADAFSEDKAVAAPVAAAPEKDALEKELKQEVAAQPLREVVPGAEAKRNVASSAGYYKNRQDSVSLKSKKQADKDTQSELAFRAQQQFGAKTENMSMHRNVFRGQVTDNNNNAVPFANITNTADNVGTYTDARGNFVLTSPDSVLHVQVRSVGFENNIAQLQNQTMANRVIMQDDEKSLSEVVLSHKKITNRSRTSNMVLEEPEPVDGWDNYDVYVANNLSVPETYRTKQSAGSGEVELSFDVNKNGEPVNITVEKSLCESCDKEAIRLIKEGPKWKRKARKKGRTSVTISF